jgi:ABC-type transport system involved in multi-copper enzyme maturation permease subunit
MIRSFRAEMLKLRRRSVLWAAGVILPGFALLATILGFVNAKDTAVSGSSVVVGTNTTLQQLAQPGGLTQGFSNAATFVGIIVFVLFLTGVTSEYGQGTLRVALTRQPRRGGMLAGKLLALLGLTAAALLGAEVLSAVASVLLAHVRDVSTADWFTGTGLSQAAADYGNALLSAALFGAAGTALGVLLRSTMLALAVGLAWIGPLEHIVQLSWSDAGRWFPGLLFDAVDLGGSDVTSYSRALMLSLAFASVLLVVSGISFVRRDVTS